MSEKQEGELKKRLKSYCDNDDCTGKEYSTLSDSLIDGILDEAAKEFLAIYPEEYIGGTMDKWIATLENLISIQTETANRIGARPCEDNKKLLETLKWFRRWFGEKP